ncbi:unnamed protein product [Phytophthora fragariaefolia]|uniref:Unnamed protein product n=1 Tax=Phytophthora fragariaefolia TaxID=1490495 RepID=A0A9W6XNF0_9STRA|nr:unnamed protein product [Phytophthora fragariaefolia]
MMVRAKSEGLFNDYLSALTKLCIGKPLLMEYFTENWLPCKDQWCTFERGDIPHLDNNTNNRLEANWGAAKDLLHRNLAMDDCIDHLLFLQQSAKDQYNYKVKRVGFRYNHGYDKEMSMLAKLAHGMLVTWSKSSIESVVERHTEFHGTTMDQVFSLSLD